MRGPSSPGRCGRWSAPGEVGDLPDGLAGPRLGYAGGLARWLIAARELPGRSSATSCGSRCSRVQRSPPSRPGGFAPDETGTEAPGGAILRAVIAQRDAEAEAAATVNGIALGAGGRLAVE